MKTRKGADMETIANELGVSKTTVHYALRDTGRVSEVTRQRVREMAQKLGYRPNLLARSLRTQRTDSLGVVLVSLTTTFHARLLEGIDAAAQKRGYTMLLACSYSDAEKQQKRMETLLERGVDGLIVAPASPDDEDGYLRRLQNDQTPLIFVDRTVDKVEVDSVASDNVLGGRVAAEHLIESGRTRLAFITTIERDRRSTSVRDRLDGFNAALRNAGLPPAVVLGEDVPADTTEDEFGAAAVRAAWEKTRSFPYDGVFAVHDGIAYGAMEALEERAFTVPGDVAVVGFDDQSPSRFVKPSLTTVSQPAHEIGEVAADLLLDRLAAKEDATGPIAAPRLEPRLIRRQST